MAHNPTQAPTQHVDVLIIGSGPAGYSAAIYAARALLSTVLLQGPVIGGQLTTTTDVENYPGFARAITGPFLMDEMQEQAKHAGAQLLAQSAVSLELSDPKMLTVLTDEGVLFHAKTIIIATGAQAKWLGIPSEEAFKNKGVSACATCDGFFYRNKNVAVVGGGNTAVEEALYLSNIAKHVTVIHRSGAFKCEKILEQRLLKTPNIAVKFFHEVDEILGSDATGVSGIKLKHAPKSPNASAPLEHLTVDGVFIAIGHSPVTRLLSNQVVCDQGGYITLMPKDHMMMATSAQGVFAAGDVCDSIYRQAVSSAGMGCMAALDAQKYIQAHYAK